MCSNILMIELNLGLDHQPLFGKGARAPAPKNDADQTRESGENRT